MNEQALIILGRFPKAGFVKSRLGKEIGDEKAALFYQKCAEHTFSEVEKISKQLKIYFLYADKTDSGIIKSWVPQNYHLIAPFSDNINLNILAAFKYVFSLGNNQAIIIATDIPGMKSRIIIKAFDKLNGHDIVLGPDQRKGIYLYGQNMNHPQVFDINSNLEIFPQVVKNLKSAKLNYFVLEEMIDVDTKKDLEKWQGGSNDKIY